MDQRINCVNRKTKPKMFGYNKLIPSNTMWKYPTVQYEGEFQNFDHNNQIPDRKMYFMVFACPMTGPPLDPGQDMHDVYVEPHKNKDEIRQLRDNGESVMDLEDLDTPIPRTFVQEGSVVLDSFGPVAGPSTRPMETIEEDPDDNCHDPAPIFHFPPPSRVIPTMPTPPVTQPAHAQQAPVQRQSPASIPLPPSPPPIEICPPSPPRPTLTHLMPQSDVPNLADAYMQTLPSSPKAK